MFIKNYSTNTYYRCTHILHTSLHIEMEINRNRFSYASMRNTTYTLCVCVFAFVFVYLHFKSNCLCEHDYGFLWFISLSFKWMFRLNAKITLDVNQLSLRRTDRQRKWDFLYSNSFESVHIFDIILCTMHMYKRDVFFVMKYRLIEIGFDKLIDFNKIE